METKYGDLPDELIISNETDLINQIFKLLPYKEQNNSCLNYHFDTLLFRISGLAKVLPQYPEWITVLSLLEAAKTESDLRLYRKAVLDCCSIVERIQSNA